MPEKELILAEGGQLHRVFEEARASGKSGSRNGREPRIVVFATFENAAEI